jgi:regulator of protease activity HflC (stomatin/prohibitin superfamily)
VLGQVELDDLLGERDTINKKIQEIIDHHTAPWGIKVTSVEIRDVGLPADMQRAMAQQAETERDRRAKVINAEGEFQAAKRMVDAAQMMS